MSTILASLRPRLVGNSTETHFDSELIDDINSAFAVLNQLGAGPASGFTIDSTDALEWDDFSENEILIGFVKSYVYKKVRLVFDPPQSSAAVASLKEQIAEDEWRIREAAEAEAEAEEEEEESQNGE